MVENFDPNTIEEEGLRQVFISVMNTWWKTCTPKFKSKPKKSSVCATRIIGSRENKASPASR
jgi:hypothetical protein